MPRPRKNEPEKAFVSRFIAARKHEGKDESTSRSAAIAHSIYRERKASASTKASGGSKARSSTKAGRKRSAARKRK